ncbi:MAG TPA: hypothetical protein ENJ65_01055 [Candidatus Tenderia electrophaga]|uniref:Uncharacterized protein n=1 Tax=Candidatus Tenderia electrophaga TaxID=1748243 RepID=A0A832J5G1_9GAMM|nr:hypothetical protein [Candidatus Tenderia electrophaga]
MKPFKTILFPDKSRDFKLKRWLKITLRTTHLIGITGMATYVLNNTLITGWLFYIHLTIASGVAIMLLDIWSNGVWLLQLRGQAIIAKLILFAGLLLTEQHNTLLFFSIIIISGLIAHAPSNVRYYSIFHRRRIESLYNIDQQPVSAKKCYFD